MDECLLRHPDDSTPCQKEGRGWRAGESRGLDMHIKPMTQIPGDGAGYVQPAEFLFSQISLGEVIQQSLTLPFLQINNTINWIYSAVLTPDVLRFRLPPLRLKILLSECLLVCREHTACIRRGMTHKSHICSWFEAMTM